MAELVEGPSLLHLGAAAPGAPVLWGASENPIQEGEKAERSPGETSHPASEQLSPSLGRPLLSQASLLALPRMFCFRPVPQLLPHLREVSVPFLAALSSLVFLLGSRRAGDCGNHL
jgi:hypothetical protein